MIELNRILFIGELNASTPYIVVDEIAESLGIINKSKHPDSYSPLIKHLVNLKKWKVDLSNLTSFDYGKMSAYLNPTLEFTRKEILEGVTFLTQLVQAGSKMEYLPGQYPKIRDASILYGMIKRTPHPLPLNISYAELVEAYQFRHYSVEKIRQGINFRLTNLQFYDAVKLYHQLKPDLNFPPLTENLEEVGKELKVRKSKIPCLVPYTPNEAILIAAENYKINLRLALHPLVEFEKLLWLEHDGYLKYLLVDKNNKDPHQELIAKIDPEFLDLKVMFDGFLPRCVYNKVQLMDLLKKLGITGERDPIGSISLEHLYLKLQENLIYENFYLGKQVPSEKEKNHYAFTELMFKQRGELTTTTTITGEDVHDTEEEVLVYGVKYQKFTPVTFTELSRHFDNANGYLNLFSLPLPNTNERQGGRNNVLFKPECIQRLRYLCGQKLDDPARMQCLTSLNRISILMEQGSGKAKELITFYGKANQELKQLLSNSLLLVRDLAMYMRGWKGEGSMDHAVKVATHDENEEALNKRCNDALMRLEQQCHPMIGNLPLVKYDEGKFILTTNPAVGLTIKQRLVIAASGYTVDANSCLRTSSNYFAASSYRYLVLLKINPGFNIDDLRYIG